MNSLFFLVYFRNLYNLTENYEHFYKLNKCINDIDSVIAKNAYFYIYLLHAIFMYAHSHAFTKGNA